MVPVINNAFESIFLDKIHPFGNKHYKLKNNLLEAKRKGYIKVITFGGAWSNSVHALAHVAVRQGIETVAVIRGERPVQLSIMLKEVEALGMHLHFVSRADYRRRHQSDFLGDLLLRFPGSYLLPEGGTNLLAVLGAGEIVADVDAVMIDRGQDYDVIALPVATGGTLAGIAMALPAGKRVLGISVLKGSGPVDGGLDAQGMVGDLAGALKEGSHADVALGGLEADVGRLIEEAREGVGGRMLEEVRDGVEGRMIVEARSGDGSGNRSGAGSDDVSGAGSGLNEALDGVGGRLIEGVNSGDVRVAVSDGQRAASETAVSVTPNWSIDHRFHCGGYARCPAYLREFILSWEAQHGEQLDPVYTGKLFYGLAQMQLAGEFSPGTRVLALHTGGQQGRRGFEF
jgi:1-aminocyclopropane-1-carboxylate deaminase/D-cysteine desulfhydrase-like pyridoxal-dependent ACC family enzyme